MCHFDITKVNFKNCAILGFHSACFVIAFIVSYDQLKKYFRNEDTSSFKIKNYDSVAANKYPDLSICFSISENIKGYNESSFPLNVASWNKDTFLYLIQEKILNIGNISLRHDSEEKPQSTISEKLNDPDSFQSYWLIDAFEDSWVVSSNNVHNADRSLNNRKQQPKVDHTIIWIDLSTVCITRKLPYTPFDVMERQLLLVKTKEIQMFHYFWIFIHPPNQLIRKVRSFSKNGKMFGTAAYNRKITKEYNETKNLVDIYITNVKAIERRTKSDAPCNDDQDDDDGKWIENAIKTLKCVPIFWGSRMFNGKDDSVLSPCTNHYQYSEALKYTQDTSIIAKQYDPPCKTLDSTYHFDVTNAKSEGINLDTADLMIEKELIYYRIRYKMRDFEEITNQRSFTGWDLFGQVGGIVGLMLGFSFSQLPELITTIWKAFNPKIWERCEKIRNTSCTEDIASND